MINDRIRFPQVRVVDEQNEQLGIFPIREAIDMARDRGVDLVLVAPQAQPPVCRTISWGKFKYEQSKKKVKPKGSELKMVRLHPRTGVHDRDILIRHSERFLREGHKVRVLCQFKGRENAYPELGKKQMDAIADALVEVGLVEGQVTKQGRDMTMMLTPKPGVKPLPKVIKDNGKGKKSAESEEDEDAKFAAMQAELAAEAKAEGGDEVVDDEAENVDDEVETDVEAEDATSDDAKTV